VLHDALSPLQSKREDEHEKCDTKRSHQGTKTTIRHNIDHRLQRAPQHPLLFLLVFVCNIQGFTYVCNLLLHVNDLKPHFQKLFNKNFQFSELVYFGLPVSRHPCSTFLSPHQCANNHTAACLVTSGHNGSTHGIDIPMAQQ
jgi:hypothetical protein